MTAAQQDPALEAGQAIGTASARDMAYDHATGVIDDEACHLKRWRGQWPQVGLALSGGGIRSATYCLGVLQALAYKQVLPQVDYLSTVSGGGYIGASLTYLLHQSASGAAAASSAAGGASARTGPGDKTKAGWTFDVSKSNFPYMSYPMVSVGEDLIDVQKTSPAKTERSPISEQRLKGRLLRRLRQSSNYLLPGDGITALSLAGVIVRNLAASLAVHVALLVMLFQLLFFWPPWGGPSRSDAKIPAPSSPATAQVQTTRTEAKSATTTVITGLPSGPTTTNEYSSVVTNAQSSTSAAPAGPQRPDWPKPGGFLLAAAWVFGLYALLSLFYLLASRFFDGWEGKRDAPGQPAPRSTHRLGPYWMRHAYEFSTHWLLLTALTLLVVGGIPWTHAFLVGNNLLSQLPSLFSSSPSPGAGTGIVATLIGVAGNVWGYFQLQSGKKPVVPTGLVVAVASVALLFGLLLLVYMLTLWLHGLESVSPWLVLVAAVVALLLIGWIPNANYVSLHRFYRDRLLELFLPDPWRLEAQLGQETRYLPLHLWLWNWLTGTLNRTPAKDSYARIGRSGPGDTTLLSDVCGAWAYREEADLQQKVLSSLDAKLPPKQIEAMKRRGPYHLMNANLVLVASQDPRFRPRGGDNFLFSPLYSGSRATGWKRTDQTRRNGFTLATAMAISGAAVNPNSGPGGQGITRQPVLSVLMGLLNLRLGYWIRNPKFRPAEPPANCSEPYQAVASAQEAGVARNPRYEPVKPNNIYPGLLESFARFNLNEHASQLLLTDGGHFENLGLYELVRRRLKLIIVCDATADPDFKFTDLSNAIQKVRADFGAIIEISAEQLATLRPTPLEQANQFGGGKGAPQREPAPASHGKPEAARQGHLVVPIRYAKRLWNPTHCGDMARQAPGPMRTEQDRDEVGTLIVLKATFFQDLPADLYSYRRDHPEFPNQGTTDQFFDERQFDAYRELGYFSAFRMVQDLDRTAVRAGPGDATPADNPSPWASDLAALLLAWRA